MKKHFLLLSILLIVSLISNAQEPKQFEWVKSLDAGITVRAMDFDSCDNVYIAGYFTGTVDSDPGPNEQTETAINAIKIYNSIRLHLSLNYKTPENVYKSIA